MKKYAVCMNKASIKRRVTAAIAALYARDAFLLEHKVGERSLSAKLAFYLTPLFRGYDVDVEYNRQGLNPKDPKELQLPAICRGRGRRKVYPDIIVHRRGDQTAHNLLVIEVKRESNPEPLECDRAKILAMRSKYGYKFGVLVVLPTGNGACGRQAILEWK